VGKVQERCGGSGERQGGVVRAGEAPGVGGELVPFHGTGQQLRRRIHGELVHNPEGKGRA